MPSRKLCLATAYTSDFAAMGDICAASLRHYADVFGCDVHVETPSGDTGNRPPAWRRVLLIPELFDAGYEFVLWVDADALFVRFDVDVLNQVLPGKDLHLVRHRVDYHRGEPVPNTGIMLLRNTAWMRGFLARAWDRTAFVHHMWWENAAFISLMGYESMLDAGAEDRPDLGILSRIAWLDGAWNSSPVLSLSDPGAVIRHYGGMSRQDRIDGMRRDVERIGLNV